MSHSVTLHLSSVVLSNQLKASSEATKILALFPFTFRELSSCDVIIAVTDVFVSYC